MIEENTLNLILINTPAGNTDEGDWGLASDLERVELFENTFQQALNYATGLGCQYINVLVGNQIHKQERNKQIEMLVKNLKEVAPPAQEKNITLLIESLNSYDFPEYLINTSTGGFDIVEAVNEPNVKFLYDVHHMQLMEGNLIQTISDNLKRIGHIQISDVPGRHEPGTGEINYKNVLRTLENNGYTGYVGLEYEPSNIYSFSSALEWMTEVG